jgi:hypothetical protein
MKVIKILSYVKEKYVYIRKISRYRRNINKRIDVRIFRNSKHRAICD